MALYTIQHEAHSNVQVIFTHLNLQSYVAWHMRDIELEPNTHLLIGVVIWISLMIPYE